MSEDYFAIYLQYIVLISFGIYYFSFKDKDRFSVTMLSFMFLILSYPYIENPKYLVRDLKSSTPIQMINSFFKKTPKCPSKQRYISMGYTYFSKGMAVIKYELEYPFASSVKVYDEDCNNWKIEVIDSLSGEQEIFFERKYIP